MNCVWRIVRMKNSEEKRLERIERAMKDFKPTPEVIESIIAMNDGLYERFRMVFDDLIAVERMVRTDMEDGRLKISGYEIFPEYFFAYDKKDGIPTADHSMLMELSDGTQYMMPDMTLDFDRRGDRAPEFDGGIIDDGELNWNIEDLNLPGLENHHIHYFMHKIFQDAHTYCPADIPFLKPDDLKWQITVQYEFFNR